MCWSAFWDEPFILEQISRDGYALGPWEIPDALFTQAIADACNSSERFLIHLDSIPYRFVTQAMCERFIREYPDMLGHVPVTFRNAAICLAAVKKEAENLRLVPLALRTVELCVRALRDDSELDDAVPLNAYSEVFDTLLKMHDKEFPLGWLYLGRADGAMYSGLFDQAMRDYQYVH